MSARSVEIGGSPMDVDSEVLEHIVLGNLNVVLLRPAIVPRFGTKKNLVGINAERKVVWRADTPTSQTGDHYVGIRVEGGRIQATSFSDRIVWLDEQSGRIVGEVPRSAR